MQETLVQKFVATGTIGVLKVIAMEWDMESWVSKIQGSNDILNTQSCQATPVTLIEQTCGNGSSVHQKVAAKLPFTQSKIKDVGNLLYRNTLAVTVEGTEKLEP